MSGPQALPNTLDTIKAEADPEDAGPLPSIAGADAEDKDPSQTTISDGLKSGVKYPKP